MDLLKYDPIGEKKINNIYEYYNEPLVYSFYSTLGSLFLANLVYVNDDDTIYKWTYLPVTQKELYDIEHQKLTLFELYKGSTSPIVYLYKECNEGIEYYSLLTSDLNNEYIPDADSYIDLMDTRETGLRVIESIEDKTIKSNRYIVDLSLEVNNEHEHEIDALLLGNTLIDFQELVFSANLPAATMKQAPISVMNKEHYNMKVTQTYAASFGIRMESEKIATLFSDDPVKQSLEKIVKMFSTLEDYNNSKGYLSDYSQKSKYKFLSIIETLGKNKVDGKLSVAIPKGDTTQVLSTRFKDEQMLRYLKKESENIVYSSEELEIEGILLAFDSKASTFKFSAKESNFDNFYNGKLSSQVTDSISSIPKTGKALILIETKTKEFTGEQSSKYTLLKWTPDK